MMVAVLLGALSLGACVDDNESQSVIDVRNAKAELLKALAEQARLSGEAAKITAEAEKAYKEAWAEYYKKQAAYQGALTDQILQDMKQDQILFEAKLESLKAKYEKAMWEAKRDAAKAEQEMLDQADIRLASLYQAYYSTLNTLTSLKEQKTNNEFNLTKYKANLITLNEYITKQTNVYLAQIDKKTIELNAWKTYGGIDKADLEAQSKELYQAQYTAFAAWEKAEDAADAVSESVLKVVEVYDADFNGESTVKAVAAVQKFNENLSNYPLGSDWNEAYDALSRSKQKNLIPEDVYPEGSDGYYYISNVLSVYDYTTRTRYYIRPYTSEDIALSDKIDDVEVPMYSLFSESATTYVNQYYATGKDQLVRDLGSVASADKLATGYYLNKENAEKALADAKTALTAAETAAPKAEKAEKDASDKLDAANKAAKEAADKLTAATSAKNAANEAWGKKQEAEIPLKAAYDALVTAGKDATAAKKAWDDAIKATKAAEEAYNKAVTAETTATEASSKATEAAGKAQKAYTDAKKDNSDAKDALINAKKAVNSCEKSLASINDQIAKTVAQIANWDENKATWEALVAALNDNSYAAAVEGLKTNDAVLAYIDAAIAADAAEKAYNEAKTAAGVVSSLINSSNVKDAAAEIRACEEEIAKLHTVIAGLKEKYGQGGLDSANTYEKLIAEAEAAIAKLDAQIAVQEEIVKLAEARVKAAIAENTPAE